MSVSWFNLAIDGVLIYALVEAVFAGRRVYEKRLHLHSSVPSVHPPQPLQSESILSGASELSHFEPILSEKQSEPTQPELKQPEPTQPELNSDAEADSTEQVTEPAMLLAADLNLPLAVSLSVSDAMQGDEAGLVTSSLELDLVPPELEIPDLEPVIEAKPSAEHHSVLAEIAELGQTDAADAITHLRRYLNHSDDVIRAATVFELGELAAKRQGAEAAEIAELLMQLGQDPNPQVREQALIAWAKVQSLLPEH